MGTASLQSKRRLSSSWQHWPAVRQKRKRNETTGPWDLMDSGGFYDGGTRPDWSGISKMLDRKRAIYIMKQESIWAERMERCGSGG